VNPSAGFWYKYIVGRNPDCDLAEASVRHKVCKTLSASFDETAILLQYLALGLLLVLRSVLVWS
jgi:hypothetical protein